MKSYPVNLKLKDKKTLVVGGGKVASRKIQKLLQSQSIVKVVSPKLNEESQRLIKDKNCHYYSREFKVEDLDDIFLAVAATNKEKVNKNIAHLAAESGILVNVVDDYSLSDFTLPAVVDRGELMIAFSTGGNLPALSKKLRKSLEEEYGEEYNAFLKYIKKIRPKIINEINDKQERKKIFHELANKELIELFKENRDAAILKINKIVEEKMNLK